MADEASSVIIKYFSATSVCVNCDSSGWKDHCKRQHPFICEKSPHPCTDIPEEIQDLCQQSQDDLNRTQYSKRGLTDVWYNCNVNPLPAYAHLFIWCLFVSLSSETQRILDRMVDSKTYMNLQLVKSDSPSPSRTEPYVSYGEINFNTVPEPRIRTDRDGLSSTNSELNLRKEEPRIDEDDDPHISSGSGGLSTTAQTGAQKQEPKENIGNRSYRKICLLGLVASIIIAIVAGLSIYVSQIRLSQLLWEQHQEMNRTQTQYREQVHHLNSTVESKISENSRLNFIHNACLQNLSFLKSNMDEICQFLTSGRERQCSKVWEKYGDRCYFFSTFETSYDGARQQCSDFDSRLLEISSKDEERFVFDAGLYGSGAHWIGKCENGKVASELLYGVYSGNSACGNCNSYIWGSSCGRAHRFICEKSAPSFPEIPQKIQDLCLQTVESNSIKADSPTSCPTAT
ncbi:uncharacterized protein [Hemitrygon akajei]|uniref:uncharacterized protein n=1 Tax=Hemitrygon akajei TaxID=2704970 RepID=UPI003BFA2EAA